MILQELLGQLKEYFSADRALQEGGAPDHNIPQEYLNTIALPGTPLYRTYLKIDCPIILVRNLDPSYGLCNGTRIVITRMAQHVIEARIFAGSHAGDLVLIPRLSLVLGMDHPWDYSYGSPAETAAVIRGMRRTPTAKIHVYICWLAHILRY